MTATAIFLMAMCYKKLLVALAVWKICSWSWVKELIFPCFNWVMVLIDVRNTWVFMLIFIESLTLCGSSILFIVRQHKYYTSHLLFRTFQVISRSTPCLVIVLAWEMLWSKRCLFFTVPLGFLYRSEVWDLEGSILCISFAFLTCWQEVTN